MDGTAVFRYPYIAYDGSNSADVLAMLNARPSDTPYTIVSEDGGVLVIQGGNDTGQWVINESDVVVAYSTFGQVMYVLAAATFAAQWYVLPSP